MKLILENLKSVVASKPPLRVKLIKTTTMINLLSSHRNRYARIHRLLFNTLALCSEPKCAVSSALWPQYSSLVSFVCCFFFLFGFFMGQYDICVLYVSFWTIRCVFFVSFHFSHSPIHLFQSRYLAHCLIFCIILRFFLKRLFFSWMCDMNDNQTYMSWCKCKLFRIDCEQRLNKMLSKFPTHTQKKHNPSEICWSRARVLWSENFLASS